MTDYKHRTILNLSHIEKCNSMLRTRKINLGTFRGALISAFLAMFLVAGCDLVTVEEAQETLETAREIQQIQDVRRSDHV